MVEIPQLRSPTLDAIDAAIEDAQEREPRDYLGVSQIGNECERALWLAFRWAGSVARNARALRIFDAGHKGEARMIAWLRSAGLAVDEVDPATRMQWAVSECDGHLRGHLDGLCTGVLEAPKAVHVLECKTHNAKSFNELVKFGVAISKPAHMAQMQVYMALTGNSRALYLALCKDDERLHLERVKHDLAMSAALIAKAARIIGANRAPERISANPDFFLCRFCDYRAHCHGGGWAGRNCRTCLHSAPAAKGQWYCTRHLADLDRHAQREGCHSHLFIPDLVPGEQVDADEASQTVTYTLRDGSAWVDGWQPKETRS